MPLVNPSLRVRRRLAPASARVAFIAPALVAIVLASAGCDVAFSGFREEESDTWTRSYPLSPSGRVEIANTNGFIEVSLRQGVEDYSFVPQQLIAGGFRLTMLKEEEANLETAFMRLTKGMVQ